MIAASGPLRASALRPEYGGPATFRLSTYRRGHASGLVKANNANNPAVNLSAAVPTAGALRLSVFRGQAKGWKFTNSSLRTNYVLSTAFGSDWTVDWPKHFVNDNTIGATAPSNNALTITGALGKVTFENNGEVRGAGGVANSGTGGNCIYMTSMPIGDNKPIIINNTGAGIRGGGGGGGRGGAGGNGGQGYYYYTVTEGPYWANDNDMTAEAGEYWARYLNTNKLSHFIWFGSDIAGGISGDVGSITVGGYYYYRAVYQGTVGQQVLFSIGRQYQQIAYTSGGGGGAGGAGGRGQGYDGAAAAGAAGASGGAAGGTNAGAGAYGGTGGSGSAWGSPGNAGGAGGQGWNGNYTLGTAGGAGSAGGVPGYGIYSSSPWSLSNAGTINGVAGGGVSPTNLGLRLSK